MQNGAPVTRIPSRQGLGALPRHPVIFVRTTKHSLPRRGPFWLVEHEKLRCSQRVFKEIFSEGGNLYY